MFSGLSNLIWGTTQTETAEEKEQSPSRLKSEGSDDEWEFVDNRKSSRSGSPARQVQTHPMENLLIEHPSMSVYDTRGRPSSTGHESDNGHESSSDTEMTDDNPSTSTVRSRGMTSHTSARSRVITAKQELLAQQRVKKSMQSLQKKKDSKKLAKSQLHRSNLVAHAKSSGKSNRQHIVMQPKSSGAKSNTKSQ